MRHGTSRSARAISRTKVRDDHAVEGTADAIRTVATGGAELGFIDIPSLVASGSAGASVKIVAANCRKPPYCIFTLNPGANVTGQEDGGTRTRFGTASFVPDLGGIHGNEQGRQQDAEDRTSMPPRCADARGRQGAINRSVPHGEPPFVAR
jgi:hypothetical protein